MVAYLAKLHGLVHEVVLECQFVNADIRSGDNQGSQSNQHEGKCRVHRAETVEDKQ